MTFSHTRSHVNTRQGLIFHTHVDGEIYINILLPKYQTNYRVNFV